MKTIKLTDNQRNVLRRVLNNTVSGEAISSEMYRALKRKGLVHKIRTYERVEWNRVIARLPVCIIEPARKAEVEAFFAAYDAAKASQ